MGRRLAPKNAWIRIWHGHHQPVHQDIYNGTNSSKTHDDNKMTLLIQNQVKIYIEHLGFCFDLSPVWHQPCSVMSLVLSFYYSIFTLQKEISHTPTRTYTQTHSDTNRPRADWCCFTLGTLCSKGPHSHHCVCLGVLPIQDLPLSLTCLPDICIHLRLAGRC